MVRTCRTTLKTIEKSAGMLELIVNNSDIVWNICQLLSIPFDYTYGLKLNHYGCKICSLNFECGFGGEPCRAIRSLSAPKNCC